MSQQTSKRPALFVDRDGVINVAPPVGQYVTRPEELELRPGVVEALRLARGAGYLIIVITNQRGVSLGLMTMEDLEAVHARMREELARGGAQVDDIYVCPHGLDDDCECRKPKPGMILAAAEKWGIELSQSFVLGDSDRDLEAGRRAGCRTIRITDQYGPLEAVFDILAAAA